MSITEYLANKRMEMFKEARKITSLLMCVPQMVKFCEKT